VSLTRAILRNAEFGFLGVVVDTLMHTPRLKGDDDAMGLFFNELNVESSAGAFDFFGGTSLPFFTN